jgi:hypothetical protein
MSLSIRQLQTLDKIRDLEMGGPKRFIYAGEAQELYDLELVEKQFGTRQSYRLTAKGRKALDLIWTGDLFCP